MLLVQISVTSIVSGNSHRLKSYQVASYKLKVQYRTVALPWPVSGFTAEP